MAQNAKHYIMMWLPLVIQLTCSYL